MRTIREILRLGLEEKLTNRAIGRSCGISHTTVAQYLARANKANLDWKRIQAMEDCELRRLIEGKGTPTERRDAAKPMPDMNEMYFELRKKGVTLQLLWEEYRAKHPDGYGYSRFCDHYREWEGKTDVVMRQNHRVGEKMFVDFCGQKVGIVDPETGEIKEAAIFVATLGASNFTFVEATVGEDTRSWLSAHVHAFEYFGGVPRIVVPDNLKAGVLKACRYEPDINPAYQALASHYNVAVIPARPYKPRDKAKVESAVLVVSRWILAAIRNVTFFSLEELNANVKRLAEKLNDRKFKKLDGTRRTVFEAIDRPTLAPLPERRFEYAEFKKMRVWLDYHVEIDHHHYSVPYTLVKREVEVWVGLHTVEIHHGGKRVALHQRSFAQGGWTTLEEHRPKSHRLNLEWPPERIINWARSTGPKTGEIVQGILERKPHPEQGYRSCIGIIKLGERYGRDRVEAASARALALNAFSYHSVKSILKRGLDRVPLGARRPDPQPVAHDNIRGRSYFEDAAEADVCEPQDIATPIEECGCQVPLPFHESADEQPSRA